MTFPQNAYVLEILKYVKRSAKEKRDKFEQCKEHERDRNMCRMLTTIKSH